MGPRDKARNRARPPSILPLSSIERSFVMSDDPTNRGGQDKQRISLGQDHEVRYWTEKFQVTPDELRDAVDKVGDRASAVAQELGRGL
jgi:hypothetical protein